MDKNEMGYFWKSLDEPLIIGKQKLFLCPTHGEVEYTIQSTIKGHESRWCQICWLESLERTGVNRVTEIKN